MEHTFNFEFSGYMFLWLQVHYGCQYVRMSFKRKDVCGPLL